MCHLHDFLPFKRAARAVMQEIIARCCVGQARDEVIHSERKLCLCRERGVVPRANISCARRVGSNGFSAVLRVCEKLRAERTFEFKHTKHRFDAALELLVISDGVREVRAPYFLCFFLAERNHEKVPPIVHGARAHVKIKLEVGNKSSDLFSGQLAEARSARQLE